MWTKFAKMGHSLPKTPMNQRAKFDAASFFLAGDIGNRTNKQTHKTQTVNDISYYTFAYRHVWIIKKIYRVFDDTEFFGLVYSCTFTFRQRRDGYLWILNATELLPSFLPSLLTYLLY